MATYSGQGIDISFTADVDLSGSQYRFVAAASTVGKVGGPAAANGTALGVLQNTPKAGEEARVRIAGTTKVELASLSAASHGGYLKTASNGQAEGYQSITACVFALAVALGEPGSAASGVFIEAQLFTPGFQG